ncbi:unnamed protein product [Adineta ricciae]|uniref:Uncharacterized protein n=1 Tax=Adineta ricciae TaxID=249248 RepID=A0A814UUG0_ADIRI|nr:unnamed protein product [Adineta ricciae]
MDDAYIRIENFCLYYERDGHSFVTLIEQPSVQTIVHDQWSAFFLSSAFFSITFSVQTDDVLSTSYDRFCNKHIPHR